MLTLKQLIAKLQEIENQDLEVLIPNDENSDGSAFVMIGIQRVLITQAGQMEGENDGLYFEDCEGFEESEGFKIGEQRSFLAIT